MENILDEQMQAPIRRPSPILIRFFIFFVCTSLIGMLLKIQAWPYASPTLYFAHFGTVITGVIAFFTDAFHPPQKKDNYIRFGFLLFWLGLIAMYSNTFLGAAGLVLPAFAFIGLLIPFFTLSHFFLLLRYYTTDRQYVLALDILKIPFMLLFAPLYVGAFFKKMSWPYASEIITLSILGFVLLTFLNYIYKVFVQKKEGNRILAFVAILVTNSFMFGVLFKIQSWPFASELLTMGVFGIVLTALLHFVTQKSTPLASEEAPM